MNTHELQTARKIAKVLDRAAKELPATTAAQLAAARERALGSFRRSPEFGLAWAGQLVSRVAEQPRGGIRYVLPMAILILGLVGIVY